MKKLYILLVVSLLTTSFGFFDIQRTQAADAYFHVINLSPGWNAVSTPRLVESHSFGAAETTANFDVYVLNPASASGWSTMADIGQTEFTPLYGYFVNNKTGANQNLTLNYKQNVEPNQRLFSRALAPGWNVVGVANPSYALKQADPDSYDTNNVSNILNTLSGCAGAVLDVTADQTNKSSVKVGDAWNLRVWHDVNQLNDLRETKAYAVYTISPCTLEGSQDNDEIAITELISISKNMLLSDGSSSNPTGIPGSTNTRIASFIITAGAGEASDITQIVLKDVSATTQLDNNFRNFKLMNGSTQINGYFQIYHLTDFATKLALPPTYVFTPTAAIRINAGTQYVVDVYADIKSSSQDTGVLLSPVAYVDSIYATGVLTTNFTGLYEQNLALQNVFITLRVNNSIIILDKNSNFGDGSSINYSGEPGSTNTIIASFIIMAGAAEASDITQIVLKDASFTHQLGDNFTNLKIKHGNDQIGQTIPMAGTSRSTAVATYVFTPSAAIRLNAGAQHVVDVYADIKSSPQDAGVLLSPVAYVDSVSATGVSTSSNTGLGSGQNLALQNAYITGSTVITAGTLTVENVPSLTQVKSNIVYENQADVELYKFKMTALTENVDITRFIISDTIAAGTLGATVANGTPTSTIYNFKLYDGATLIAGPISLTATATPTLGGYIDFNLGGSSPYRINSGVDKVLTLKGTISSWPSISSGSTHTFSLNTNPLEDGSTRAVTARGVGSSASLNGPTTGVSGNAIAVRRAYPVVERLTLSSTSLSGGSTSQKQLANFKVTAVGGQVRLKKLTFDVSLTDTTTSTPLVLSNFKLYRNGSLMGSTEYSIFDGTGTAAADALSPGGSATLSTATLSGSASNGNIGNSTSTRIVVLIGTQITDLLGVAGTGGSEEVIASGSSNTYEIKADVANAHSGASMDTDSVTVQLLGDDAETAHLTGNLTAPSGSITSVMYRYGVVSLNASTNYNFIWSDYSAIANEHKSTYFPVGTGKDWTYGYQVPSSTGQSSFIPLDSWVVSR